MIKRALLLISFSSFLLQIFAQNLVSVTPNQGPQGTTLQVTMTGQGTHFNQATYTAVYFSQGSSTIIYPNTIVINSTTQLQSLFDFTYQHPAGYYQANVYNFTDGWLALPNAFLLQPGPNAPAIINVSPSSANQGQSLSVTVTGQNTHFLQATMTTFWFSQGSSTIIYPVSSTVNNNLLMEGQMDFTYQHPTGYYDVNSYNTQDGLLTLPNSFWLGPGANPPMLVSVTPSNALQGNYISLMITGQNTHFQQATYTVELNNGFASYYSMSSSVISNTSLQANYFLSWMYWLGSYSVVVQNAVDGILSLTNGFEVLFNAQHPYLLPDCPDTLIAQSNTAVPIYGKFTHFALAGNNATRLIGPAYIEDFSTVVVNDTFLIAYFNLTGVPQGNYSLSVLNGFDMLVELTGTVYVSQSVQGIHQYPDQMVKVYPNPSKGIFYLELPEGKKYDRINCFDASGRELGVMNGNQQGPQNVIDMEKYPSGVYILKISSNNHVFYTRLLKE